MGIFGSKSGSTKKSREDALRTRDFEQQLEKDAREKAEVTKLLLLGAGESGKSTLFKQTIQLYGSGYDDGQRDQYTQIIYRNTLSGMHILVKESASLQNGEFAPSAEHKDAVQYFTQLNTGDLSLTLTQQAAGYVMELWALEGIKSTFEQRAKFQIPDSASYFFENVSRIVANDYVPTYEDVLRCRCRTTGIVETDFVIGRDKFKIMDVGGQRSERKKWINCFDDVTAVIFVAAVNEYDQNLFEDNKTNRVQEALSLFGQTCNGGWFENAAVILFLNKRDLFADKIQMVDLNVCFPDYTGGCNYDSAMAFLKEVFEEQNENPDTEVFIHETCATDQESVQFTFDAVRHTVIKNSIAMSGLI